MHGTNRLRAEHGTATRVTSRSRWNPVNRGVLCGALSVLARILDQNQARYPSLWRRISWRVWFETRLGLRSAVEPSEPNRLALQAWSRNLQSRENPA